MNVLLIIEPDIFREGLKNFLLKSYKESKICESFNKKDVFENMTQVKFDLIVVDIDFDTEEKVSLLEDLFNQYKHLKIIVTTSFCSEDEFEQVFKLGVMAYLKKSDSMLDYSIAIKKVLSNREFICSDILNAKSGKLLPNIIHGNVLKKLSIRETEVIKMISKGMTGKEIASALNISVKTFDTYRSRLFQKFNVSKSTELVNSYNKMTNNIYV